MTFRTGQAGFAPTGVVFEARDFEPFANALSSANDLLQGLNRQIDSTVNNFNRLSRNNRQISNSFRSLGRGVDFGRQSQQASGFRRTLSGLGEIALGAASDLDDAGQSVLRFAGNLAGPALRAVTLFGAAVGTAVGGTVVTAASFEDAFAGVTKTVEGLSDLAETERQGFVVLTEEGEALKQSLVDLSNQIPATFEDLSTIAQLGGQLGLVEGLEADEAQQTLTAFTETVAGLAEATNLSEEAAATSLARIANIYRANTDISAETIRNLGNTLVELGNTTATTEREIVNFAQRLAGAGNTVGASQADILGIAAAFSSVGIRAEAGGTALSTALLEIQQAAANSEGGFINNTEAIERTQDKISNLQADLVRLESQTGITGQSLLEQRDAFLAAGGSAENFGRQLGDARRERLFNIADDVAELTTQLDALQASQGQPFDSRVLEEFTRVVNQSAAFVEEFGQVSTDQFQEIAKSNPAEILTAFTEGLAAEGENAANVLDSLGLGGIRSRDAFLRMAGAGDLLRQAIGSANGEWETGNALARETANRYATLQSRFQIFRNQIRSTAASLGDDLIPAVNRTLEATGALVTQVGDRLPEVFSALGDTFAPLFEEIGASFEGLDFSTIIDQGIDRLIAAIEAFDPTPLVDLFVTLRDDVFPTFNTAITTVMDNWDTFSAALSGAGLGLGALAAIGAVGLAISALLSPIGLVVGGAAALALAWDTNFLGIQTTTEAVVGRISELWTGLTGAFEQSGIEGAFDFLNIPEGVQTAIFSVSTAFNDLTDSIVALGDNTAITNFFEGLGETIGNALPVVAGFGLTLATAFVQSTIDRIGSLIGIFDGIVTAIDGLVSLDLTQTGEGLAQIGTNVVDFVLSPLQALGEQFGVNLQAQLAAGIAAISIGETLTPFAKSITDGFNNITLPELDLSPIRELITNALAFPEGEGPFADFLGQFDGVGESLSGLTDSFGGLGDKLAEFDWDSIFGSIGEAIGNFIALELTDVIDQINALAAGIAAVGQFALDHSENIGAFFSSFIETPIDQVTGIVDALSGITEIAGAESLSDIGSGLETFANGLLQLATAPAINLAETFTATEIAPPTIDFSQWGVQLLAAQAAASEFFSTIWDSITLRAPELNLEAFQTAFTDLFADITIPFPEFDLTTIGTQAATAITAIQTAFVEAFTNFNPFANLNLGQALVDAAGGTDSLLGGLLADALNVEEDARQAGVDSVDGYTGGVRQQIPDATAAGEETGEGWLSGLATALGIQSPSTVAQQAGADTVAGFVLGLQDISTVVEALNTLTTTILESFTGLGVQITEVLAPGFTLLNDQFTRSVEQITILSEVTASYNPIVGELTLSYQELGQVLNDQVIPPFQRLDQVQRLARDSSRRLERSVKELAKAYKTLASALQSVRRAQGATGGIPQSAGAAPAASAASGGTFLVPSNIPASSRGPTGGMLYEFHPGELVQVFSRAMTRQLQAVPTTGIVGSASPIREPSLSGAGISNQINRTINTTTNEGSTELHLHVSNPVSPNVIDSFDLMRSLTRRRV